jgi:hypothetical protein
MWRCTSTGDRNHSDYRNEQNGGCCAVALRAARTTGWRPGFHWSGLIFSRRDLCLPLLGSLSARKHCSYCVRSVTKCFKPLPWSAAWKPGSSVYQHHHALAVTPATPYVDQLAPVHRDSGCFEVLTKETRCPLRLKEQNKFAAGTTTCVLASAALITYMVALSLLPVQQSILTYLPKFGCACFPLTRKICNELNRTCYQQSCAMHNPCFPRQTSWSLTALAIR